MNVFPFRQTVSRRSNQRPRRWSSFFRDCLSIPIIEETRNRQAPPPPLGCRSGRGGRCIIMRVIQYSPLTDSTCFDFTLLYFSICTRYDIEQLALLPSPLPLLQCCCCRRSCPRCHHSRRCCCCRMYQELNNYPEHTQDSRISSDDLVRIVFPGRVTTFQTNV